MLKKASKLNHPQLENLNFQKSNDIDLKSVTNIGSSLFTVRFDNISFSNAMAVISSQTNAPVVWSPDCDNVTVSGIFENQSVSSILSVIARRCNASLAEVGGVFYIGTEKKTDNVISVVRLPAADPKEIIDSIKPSMSEFGNVSVVGSCLWVSDRIDNVRKVVFALENLRNKLNRSYIAEVFFIRIREQDLLQLQASLRVNQVDIFASSFNVEQLFSMFVNADGSVGNVSVDHRPVLYLTEGRKSIFEDGSDIVLERKSISPEGYATTTGYEKFTDGLKITMSLNRVNDVTYSLDIDLSVSVFQESEKQTGVVPRTDRSTLKQPGMLVTDGNVFYAGSIRRTTGNSGYGLFTFRSEKLDDILTVWVRVRELKRD
jgi:type II secretory pathway component GspD/PulD (secretin)